MKPTTLLHAAALLAALLLCQRPAVAGEAAPPTLALPADWYPESVAAGPDGAGNPGGARL